MAITRQIIFLAKRDCIEELKALLKSTIEETKKEEGWLCGTGCLRVTIDSEKADSRFVFFQLQHPDTVGWVEKHAVGATMLNLNTTILSSVPIRLPALEIQKELLISSLPTMT